MERSEGLAGRGAGVWDRPLEQGGDKSGWRLGVTVRVVGWVGGAG